MIDRWTAVLAELERMRSLKDGWDGEGTKAPEPGAFSEAVNMATVLRFDGSQPPDRVHVGVNGTIYFEWYSENGCRAVEFESSASIAVRFVPIKDLEMEASHV